MKPNSQNPPIPSDQLGKRRLILIEENGERVEFFAEENATLMLVAPDDWSYGEPIDWKVIWPKAQIDNEI